MGYYTRVDGEITITPPIPWNEFKDSAFFHDGDGWPAREVMLRVETNDVDTPEGTLIRRTAVAVVPCSDDQFKAYEIDQHLTELVAEFGEGRTFNGALEGEGEENGDMWRLKVTAAGEVVKVKPTITWPED